MRVKQFCRALDSLCRRSLDSLLTTCLILAFCSAMFAQSVVTGGVTGVITDPTGAVVPNANVVMKNLATQQTQSTKTNPAGIYSFSLLKPGPYEIRVTQSGFQTATSSVDVTVGQNVAANLTLTVGNTSETIEVTSEGGTLQTEDANVSSEFDTRTFSGIPNPGGDITWIAQVSPGVTMNNSTGGGFGNFSAYGLPGTSNLFTINGNDYNDAFLNLNNSGSSNLLLGGNEVQEVAVVSNGYTGQYGRQAGAQVDYTTKSGTNAFHGDAVYDWTGRELSANNWFNNFNGVPRPFENNNQWAAAIGGPIKKDKAFFFLNTEGIRYIFGTSATVNVPTPQFEQFVLSKVPATAQSFYKNAFNIYNAAPGISRAVAQGNSSCDAGVIALGFTGSCLQQFGTSSANGNREWLLSGRVDYSVSDSDKLFGRFKVDRGQQPTYTDPINPAFNAQSIQPQNEGQLNYTHIFSPTLVNNFVFSDLWYSAVFKSANQSAALSLFPEVLISTDSPLTALGTGSGSPGGTQAGFLFPQGRNVEQWQIVDDVSLAKGNHSFKMGLNFKRDDVTDFTAGEEPYPVISTSLAGFATDQVTVGGAGNLSENFALHNSQPLAFYSFGLYFQDEYRVNPHLKMTLTLRADRNSPGVCQSNCAVVPTAPFDQLAHGATIPYDQSFVNGNHQILPNVEKVVFQPRFGVAWTPFGQNTVIRGGVGLFSDLYPGGILDSYTTNFPQVQTYHIASGSIVNTEAGSGANIASSCATAFLNNFNTGGNLNTYKAAAPQCGGIVPNFTDTVSSLQNPKFLEWNFEVERSIGPKRVLTLNYVGNRGYDLLLYNPYLNAFNNTPGTPGFGLLPTAAPDPRVGTVTQLTNNNYSNYNGLTVSFRQNEWHGLSAGVNYTWSHASDLSSNGGVINEPYSVLNSIQNQVDPFNPKAQYGPSDYDLRHNFTAHYLWDIPFKPSNRLLNEVLGGWELGETFFYHTGFPFSIEDGVSQSGIVANNQNAVPTEVLVLAQPVSAIPSNCGSSAITTPCFTAANFSATPAAFINGLGRNALRGPGFFNTDMTLRKNFRITERIGFQLGANAFNVFNHPNFNAPSANTAFGGLFGTINNAIVSGNPQPPTSPYGAFASAAVDARIVQVQGKITF